LELILLNAYIQVVQVNMADKYTEMGSGRVNSVNSLLMKGCLNRLGSLTVLRYSLLTLNLIECPFPLPTCSSGHDDSGLSH